MPANQPAVPMFSVSVSAEIWGEEREPKTSTSHILTNIPLGDVGSVVHDLAIGLTTEYEIRVYRMKEVANG